MRACLIKPGRVEKGVVQIKHEEQLLAPQYSLQTVLSALVKVYHILCISHSGNGHMKALAVQADCALTEDVDLG